MERTQYEDGLPAVSRGVAPQGADLDELQENLREVMEMLLEDGKPTLESKFVDACTIQVAWSMGMSAPPDKPLLPTCVGGG